MNDKNKHKPKFLKYSPGVFALCAMVFFAASCSTSREPKTMRLFLQAKRPNITLPYDAASRSGTLSEQVNYTTVSDTLSSTPAAQASDSAEDVWRTVNLNAVNVVAPRTLIKQVTMRQGSVRLEFDIHVPAVLIDSCWRLTLTPILNLSDSVASPLLPVVLAGNDFIRKQEADYRAYELFLQGIVPTSAYDSIYLDRKNINRDIFQRQKSFYELYSKERDRQLAYERWKQLAIDRQNYWNMRMQTNRTTLHHRLERKRIQESVRRHIEGRDTLGLSATYSRKFRRTTSFWPMYRMERNLTAKHVPQKYRDIYLSGRSLADIRNHNLTTADSIEISKHRYFFDLIAENEMNDRNRDLIRERMIPFPYIDSVKVRELAVPGEDYTYTYTYSLPVTEGMKKLRLRLESIVEATDHSTWRPAASDTLRFVISSLSDLADRSLLERFVISTSEQTDTLLAGEDSLEAPVPVVHYSPEGEEYAEGLRLLHEREYRKALPLLQKYPDYNTVLCLLLCGYHKEAGDLLVQLPRTAKREYLHAVVCIRSGEEYAAVEHMLEACRMDPELVLRLPLDPELSDIIPKYMGLRYELNKILEGA